MKPRHKTLLIIFIILLAAVAAVWIFLPSESVLGDKDDVSNESGQYAVWERGDYCFVLEVVDTIELRRQGLSGRQSLAADRGMLFTYELSAEYGFWMKDMNFPIDIIWINADDEVVTIASRVSPDSYPNVLYPTEFAKKVIEVSAGVAEKTDLKVGDQVNVSTPTSTPSVDCSVS